MLCLSPQTQVMTEPEPQPVTTHASIVDLVSRILPGDIIQVDGQKIVIPEGASIVHTDDGIMIYESAEPGAASVLNFKLGP
ncbi:hypothetical protein EB796_006396 [Bugula neritina]|uniref:Uncharacterized protein n=1 Tax=Bugula neritina TaxID=10212 RepID=A0A7J7KCG0_BUGNE|nr:hypothetical protein EB796_006396 [Bugula neritina]